MTKQLFSLSSVETSGRFFQIFVAFSEKLDFTLISLIAEEAGINVVAGGGAKVPELINEEVEFTNTNNQSLLFQLEIVTVGKVQVF